MITASDIANFFDDIDSSYLIQFNWKPKETIDRTYTIKDRFKIKFKGLVCIYTDIEDCRIKFHIIFHDNIHYVYQCRNLLEKIQKITDSSNYEILTENNVLGTAAGKSGNVSGSNNTVMALGDQKSGSLDGTGDAATLGSLYESEAKAVLTKDIIDKKEDAIMQFLDPNLRQLGQAYGRNKEMEGRISNDVNYGTNWNLSTSNSKIIGKKKIEAENELMALNIRLPKLIDEFLECFNPLFYY